MGEKSSSLPVLKGLLFLPEQFCLSVCDRSREKGIKVEMPHGYTEG